MATTNGDANERESPAASLLATAASRFARRSSSRPDGAPLASSNSAGKYRVSSTPTATGESVSSTTDTPPPFASTQATGPSGSSAAASLKRQASERRASKKSPVKFADLVCPPSGLHLYPIDGKVGTSMDPSGNRSPTQRTTSKLPHKMRASVTVMRSQLAMLGGALTTSNNSSSAASPDMKSRSRLSSVVAHTAVSPTATAQATRARYSRQSHELLSKQAGRDQDRRASSTAAAAAVAVAMRRSMQPQRSQHSLTTDAASVLQFMELLRPLQSSLASRRDEKTGDSVPSDSDSDNHGDNDDDDDDDDDPDDALFRQHERESSRILRICCSLDNLLFAVADQVQENKHDVIAIASGPARRLVELILSGITQIADAMAATPGQDGRPSLTAKDERYLREFLVEIAHRWSQLDELLRSIYISRLQRVERELAELQSVHGELKQQKQTLELEILELREFHSSANAATMAMTSNFMRLTDQRQSITLKGPETQQPSEETLAAYDLQDPRVEKTDRDGGDDGTQQVTTTAVEEIKRLKAQCSEYGRLLEMAKQEIRLSHQERQSQHARLVELSQSLVRDQEIAQLRNELQSEKKRVKLLELESLRMRESHVDLNLKIQSLQLNPCASTGPVKTSAGRGPTPHAATPPTRSRAGSSSEMRADDFPAATQAHASSEIAATRGGALEIAVLPGDSAMRACTSSSSTALLQGTSAALPFSSSMPWLVRVLEPRERPGKPPTGEKETDDDGMIRLFLSRLLLTERELEAATAQAKLRKKSNVPTLGAPPGFSKSAATMSPTKKKKPKPLAGPADPRSVPISMGEWISDALVVASVRQLIWVLYEQYLMCEETRHLLNPQRRIKWQRDAASSAATSPSLASFVLHYFLERHAKEDDAVRDLRRFVSVLAKLRVEYGDVRLFCEFWDGSRSREELHFTLWVLQAVDAVDLGVNYDNNNHSTASHDTRLGRSVCTLKALYVTRMVFRLLHVKSLKKPSLVSPTKATGAKKTAAPAATVVATTASSPKRLRKSRPASAGAASAATSQPSSSIAASSVVETSEAPVHQSIVDRAIAEYTSAVQANAGYPLTLELFNEVVLRFAVTPSREELREQLGPFYQATGDERKVSLDVFLVLVAEAFATQLHWRHAQLQALFVRLAKDEEVEQLLAAKRLQEELAALAAAAATSKKGRAEPKEKPKKSEKKAKKRERRVGMDKSADRHLTGLSRERLRKFLVRGGLVQDTGSGDGGFQARDYDALYVAILDVTKTTPSEIHFDQVYDALHRFDLLGGSDALAVDFASWLADDGMEKSTESKSPEAARRNRQVADTWRMLAVQTLTVAENDPNMFTRHVAQELSGRAHAALNKYTTALVGSAPLSGKSELEIAHSIRECLRFTWSLATRRMNGGLRGDQHSWRPLGSCLTEFSYVNQAVQILALSTSDVDLATLARRGPEEEELDPLAVFYDCRLVNVATVEQCTATPQEPLVWKPEIERILQRYALHVAHLFDSYSAARFTSAGGLTKSQWLAMARDVGLLGDSLLTIPVLEDLFVESVSSSNGEDGTARNMSRFEVVVDKPQFTALLVHTAMQRQRKREQTQTRRRQRRQAAVPTVAQIVDQFCRHVVVPHAFHHRNRMQEEDFHRKLSCPLVAKILLEHRAFLRQLFSHFAKCGDNHDTNDGGGESRDGSEPPHVAAMRDADAFEPPQRRKTTRNSMGVAQFLSFLRSSGLLETRSPPAIAPHDDLLHLDESGAALVFRAAMAIECGDVTRMEFDEFAAAVAAIAALRKPHPFVALHAKIDAFVGELRAIHATSHVAARSFVARY